MQMKSYPARITFSLFMAFCFLTVSSGSSFVAADPVLASSPASDSVTVQYLPAQTKGLALAATILSPCKLTTQNVYLRASSNRTSVGTKATTSCTVQVLSIHQSIGIEKLSQLGFWETQGTFYGSAFNTSYFQQTNAEVFCTNYLATTWKGYVNGEVVYNGTTYYATYNSAVSPPLACGT